MQTPARVFVSATTGDLATSRENVKDALLSMKCYPVEEANFQPDYLAITEMLEGKIKSCQALIHVVGFRYGAEVDPKHLPDDAPRRSYTQREYDVACQLGKKVYVFVCAENFPFDECESEPDGLRKLQQKHRKDIMAGPRLYNVVATPEELGIKVREIQFRPYIPWQLLAGVAVLIVMLGGLTWYTRHTGSTVQQIQLLAEEEAAQREKAKTFNQQFAEEFLRMLLHDQELPVDEARKKALAKLPGRLDMEDNEVREIIDGLIKELAADTGASPLDRAGAMLTGADYKGVLKEAAKQRNQTRELEMLAGTAALAQFREDPIPKWNDEALESFQRALALSDVKENSLEWADAALWVAYVQAEVGRVDQSQIKLLRAALDVREAEYGPDAKEIAEVLNNLANSLLVENRLKEAEPLMRRALAIDEQAESSTPADVAIHLNNLGSLYQRLGSFPEAESLMRRSLTIDEQSFGTEHAKVANRLNNLASLLRATNRLPEAEPLMRRVLNIYEQTYTTEHPRFALGLNNLAGLLKATERDSQAEPLLRRALAINERSYSTVHSSIAGNLNELGQLLQDNGKLSEAEPLIRRALSIDKQLLSANHTKVGIQYHNLGGLLREKEQHVEAESCIRHALQIWEQSLGNEHVLIAFGLNNLCRVLEATERLEQAEPLRQRCITILYRFEQKTGRQHRRWEEYLDRYKDLLKEMEFEADEIEQKVAAASDATATLQPVSLEIDRLLDPTEPVDVVLATLDEKYKAEGFPDIYFLELTQRIDPHLDQLLGEAESIEDVFATLDQQARSEQRPAVYYLEPSEPIAGHLDQLLGTAKSTDEVFAELDQQYKSEEGSAVYFLPLDEPIGPYLDKLLGPVTPDG